MVQSEVGERFAAGRARRPTACPACSPSSRATCACTARSRAPSSIRSPTSTPCSSSWSAPARRPRPRSAPLVRAAFAHRRKALARSLSLSPGQGPDVRDRARAALLQLGHPADERAERLSPAEFRALAEALALPSAAAQGPQPPGGGPGSHDRAARLGAGEDQPLPLRGPDARGRPPRAGERLPADRARRRGRARARRPGLGDGSRDLSRGGGREPRRRWPCGAFASAPDGTAARCASGSRSGSRSRPGWPAAAPTPAPPCGSWPARPGSRTTRSCARSAPGSAPTSPLRSARVATSPPAPVSA